MNTLEAHRTFRQRIASPQFAAFCACALMADTASARAPLGLPDSSMLPLWGTAAVLGVVAYRLKKRK